MEFKETQGEKFFNILKKTGYTGCEKLSPKNFEYLFSIPDTSAFFNWFINNVDENCLLNKEELEKFKQKVANNQVIYDLHRLEELNSIINPSSVQNGVTLNSSSKSYLEKLSEKLNNEEFNETNVENDVDAMKREIEFQERELLTLNKEIEFQSFQKKKLSEKVLSQKAKKCSSENLRDETTNDFESVKKASKQSLQCLNKNLFEFQALFSDEEKLVKENNLFNLKEEEGCVKTYVSGERDLLNTVQEIINTEIDTDNIMNFPLIEVNKEANENDEKLRNELYLINKCYPQLLSKYINCKIEMEIQKMFYDLMEKIYENPSEFFQFNFNESQPCAEMITSERKLFVLTDRQFQIIQESIARYVASTEKINATCRSYSISLNDKTSKYSRLRILNLFQRNVIKKELDLRLTLIKQERSIRLMQNQKTRIEFLKKFQNEKLAKVEMLKVSFEEMIERGNAIVSLLSNMSKKQSLSQTQLTTSNISSNFLSSTMIAVNQNNTSMFIGSPQNRLREKSRFMPYPSPSFSFNDFNGTEESVHVNLLNQVLIQILKNLQTDFANLITLKKTVSIDFNDNMANFAHVLNSVNNLCEHKRKQWLTKNKNVDNLLELSMEYLYDKDDNFNKINMKMPKYLGDMLKKLNEKSTDIKSLYIEKIFKPYSNYTQQLERNGLIQLKRKFFVHFFNYDGDKINHIMEQLNGMMDE